MGHFEHHFCASEDGFHVSLMPQAPHGSAGGSDEARCDSLYKSPLIPSGSTHPPEVGKSKDDLPSWLFERRDEDWRQGGHDF